jgi:hypothetical protein
VHSGYLFIYKNMRKKFTFFCLSIILFCSPLLLSAQSNQVEEHIFYVQSNELNVDNYASLHEKLKSDGRFTISTACIPAHVMVVKVISPALLSSAADANYELFRTLAVQIQIGQWQLLSNYNKQIFENQCLSARTGN